MEQELTRELQLHIEQLTAQHLAEGMSIEDARFTVRREFGSVGLTEEQCRDMRGLNWFEDFVKDGRHALRSLLRAPVFTFSAVLTIALGIGVNTAVFSVIYAVLLDSLPFRDPDRLVHISSTHPDFPSLQVASPDFVDWRLRAGSFDGLAAYTFQAMNKWMIVGDGEPEPVQVVQASHGLFGMLGIEPLRGRVYTAEEESKKEPVVLLSETLWRRKYNSDPAIIGRRIRLVGWSVMVIGIVAQRQAEPRWTDIWMPMSFLDPALVETRRFRPLEVIGRLKPGVTVGQAQAEMKGIATAIEQAHPDTNGRIGAVVLPLASWATGPVRAPLLIAWAAVSLVLLLACANVAHLVLIRTVQRSREMAVRAALGAGSARLARLLLAENFAVAVAGGVLGALLAAMLLPLLVRTAPMEISRIDSVSFSVPAFVFGGVATLICMALFVFPALFQTRKLDLHQVMRQSRGFSLTQRRSRFGSTIIAVEVALAFVVLTGAGLLYSSFTALSSEDKGFDSGGVLVAEILVALDWRQSWQAFDQRFAPSLEAIPGVTHVAAANCAPMTLRPSEASRFTSRFRIEGEAYDPEMLPVAQVRWTTPNYFQTLRIPLKRGRLFRDTDMGRPGYIVNEAFVRRYFPDKDPVGQHILYGTAVSDPLPTPILGVVGDVRDLGLGVQPAPTLYSTSVSNNMAVLIRTAVPPSSLIPSVRKAIRAVFPEAAIKVLSSLDKLIENSLAQRRFALELLGVFAMLAVFLTVIGVYGVISYSLSQRKAEFAIRSALGAEQSHLRTLILTGFTAPAAAGILLGASLAFVFGKALRTQLYKLSPMDPLVLGSCAIGLLLLVLASAMSPARKAASISAAVIPRE